MPTRLHRPQERAYFWPLFFGSMLRRVTSDDRTNEVVVATYGVSRSMVFSNSSTDPTITFTMKVFDPVTRWHSSISGILLASLFMRGRKSPTTLTAIKATIG